MKFITNVEILQTEEKEKTLPAFDNTTLTAYNTCPTWGTIRYGLGLRTGKEDKVLALYAGELAHECYSAIRLLELQQQGASNHAFHHGVKLFSGERWGKITRVVNIEEDNYTIAKAMVSEVIKTSMYEEQEEDKTRTVNNIEAALYNYIDHYNFNKYPIWIKDINDPTSTIGIETPFDLVIKISYNNVGEKQSGYVKFRFIGRIDAIYIIDNKVHIIDNKTSAVLKADWGSIYCMSNQMTGYTIASNILTGLPNTYGCIHGMTFKIPGVKAKSTGLARFNFSRNSTQVAQWSQWFMNTGLQIIEDMKHPLDASNYTHSCDRYFRPCSFLPLCTDERDNQEKMFKELVYDKWNPLDDK